jgi:hypothetical protein
VSSAVHNTLSSVAGTVSDAINGHHQQHGSRPSTPTHFSSGGSGGIHGGGHGGAPAQPSSSHHGLSASSMSHAMADFHLSSKNAAQHGSERAHPQPQHLDHAIHAMASAGHHNSKHHRHG